VIEAGTGNAPQANLYQNSYRKVFRLDPDCTLLVKPSELGFGLKLFLVV
jgi:hypothetical protein